MYDFKNNVIYVTEYKSDCLHSFWKVLSLWKWFDNIAKRKVLQEIYTMLVIHLYYFYFLILFLKMTYQFQTKI